MPIDMYARLGKREVTTNVMWPTLTLHIGATTVEICPINKEQVQQLAKRLTLLAEGMES